MAKDNHKQLFNHKLLQKRIDRFGFPADLESRRGVIGKWVKALHAKKLDYLGETALHGEFLTEIFGAMLGYHMPVQDECEVWNLQAEKMTSEGGGTADGALGFFQVEDSDRIIAPIELKGARQNLDTALGKEETPVQQGWRYANYVENCKWVIVSNYKETRIYNTSKTPQSYERFLLEDLEQEEVFKRFYYLLCKDHFLSEQGPSKTDLALNETSKFEEEITDKLYKKWKILLMPMI